MKFRIVASVTIEVDDAVDVQSARIMAFDKITGDSECYVSEVKIEDVVALDLAAVEAQQISGGVKL